MINTHKLLKAGGTVALSVLLFACGNKQQQPGGGFGNMPAPTLKVMSLQPRSVTLNTEYPASIQGQQNIEIRPKVDGFVEKIYVDEGSIVKKGQLLFKINNPQYAQDERTAEAGIKTAQADVNTARRLPGGTRSLPGGARRRDRSSRATGTGAGRGRRGPAR